MKNCPLIQELEIIGRIDPEYEFESIGTDELSAIAQCVHLKRLTLSLLRLNVKKRRNLFKEVLIYNVFFSIYHNLKTILY